MLGIPPKTLARVAALLVELRADGDLLFSGEISDRANKALGRKADNQDEITRLASENGVGYDELVAAAKVWLISAGPSGA